MKRFGEMLGVSAWILVSCVVALYVWLIELDAFSWAFARPLWQQANVVITSDPSTLRIISMRFTTSLVYSPMSTCMIEVTPSYLRPADSRMFFQAHSPIIPPFLAGKMVQGCQHTLKEKMLDTSAKLRNIRQEL